MFAGQCFGELQSEAKQTVCLGQPIPCNTLLGSHCLDDGNLCLPGWSLTL